MRQARSISRSAKSKRGSQHIEQDTPDGRKSMATIKRRYGKEEFARRGDAIYESVIRPNLSPDDAGKFVAIDIDTGEYDMDADELTAGDRLRARLPEAQIWVVRVGSRSVHRFGGRVRIHWLEWRS
jgi:hypothetical protein